MRFSILFVTSLLEASALGSAILERVPVKQTCAADNCYRVMTNTLAVATPFCSTYLQSTTTLTITPVVTVSGMLTTYPPAVTATPIPDQSLPSHITSQCLLTTAPPLAQRLSSACSCLPTPVIPPTVTSTTILPVQTTHVHADSQCPTVGNPVYWTGGQRINGDAMPAGFAEVFDVYCDRSFPGTPLLVYGQHFRPGYYFAECIHLCFIEPGCQQAAYDDNYFGDSQSGCGLYSDIGEEAVIGNIYSGILVNQCNGAGNDAHCPDTCAPLGGKYTSTAGDSPEDFDITCGAVYLSDAATFLTGPTTGYTSMSQCIDLCAITPKCVAAAYTDSIDQATADTLGLDPQYYNTPVCAIASALNGNIQVGGFDSGVLSTYEIPSPS